MGIGMMGGTCSEIIIFFSDLVVFYYLQIKHKQINFYRLLPFSHKSTYFCKLHICDGSKPSDDILVSVHLLILIARETKLL